MSALEIFFVAKILQMLGEKTYIPSIFKVNRSVCPTQLQFANDSGRAAVAAAAKWGGGKLLFQQQLPRQDQLDN